MKDKLETMNIPCCPELIKTDNCDTLFFTRVLNYPFAPRQADLTLNVQLILGFRFRRCTLGLTLGDPAYSTTLLPGETVRLATTDRRSSFTYDAATQTTYRSQQISEEQYFMTASQSYFSDLESQQSGRDSATDTGKWNFKGDADGSIDPTPWSPGASASASASGSHDSSSTVDFLHNQSSNMHSAATQAVNATHKAYSMSIGEVATRTHIEGESEDHFEASSREFSNKNSCHAITYIFYRLNKAQTVTFDLVSITPNLTPLGLTANVGPRITPKLRDEIIGELTKELREAGILDAKGKPSEDAKRGIDFKLEFSLPTSGIIVKGCLDECNTCEPAQRERVHLENELLRKQIELLAKSQEYRCCPAVSDTPP